MTVPPLFQAANGCFRFLCCLAVGSLIAADYKWSLRKLDGEVYDAKIKEVCVLCVLNKYLSC
jgi:hypothetical protein